MDPKYCGFCVVLMFFHSYVSAGVFDGSSVATYENCISTIAKANFPKGSLIAIAAPSQWHSILVQPTFRSDTVVVNEFMAGMEWSFLTKDTRNMSSDDMPVRSNCA